MKKIIVGLVMIQIALTSVSAKSNDECQPFLKKSVWYEQMATRMILDEKNVLKPDAREFFQPSIAFSNLALIQLQLYKTCTK